MSNLRVFGATLAFIGVVLSSSLVWAESAPHHEEVVAAGHADTEHNAPDSHGSGHDDHAPTWGDINWMTGFLGEKEGVEPGLLWRAPGTPIPFGALLLNTAILFFLIGHFGGPGIRQGLVARKERIAGEIEKAAAMKAEAEEQLAHYEDKLAQMTAEMDTIKSEMKARAEADRERIIAEAKERRVAIETEARGLIEQELTQARYDATVKAVEGAVAAAREEIKKSLNTADHDRLAKDFLGTIQAQSKKTTEASS